MDVTRSCGLCRRAGELSMSEVYTIDVVGHLDERWALWFEGLTLIYPSADHTRLVTQPIDESSLHGILAAMRDYGIPLLSLQRMTGNPVVAYGGADDSHPLPPSKGSISGG